MLNAWVETTQSTSKHYPVEQRERGMKMVLDHLGEFQSVYAAGQAIGPKAGVSTEPFRGQVLQAQADASERLGVATAELQRIRDLEREVRELSRRSTRF